MSSIATDNSSAVGTGVTAACWQPGFLKLLPSIQERCAHRVSVSAGRRARRSGAGGHVQCVRGVCAAGRAGPYGTGHRQQPGAVCRCAVSGGPTDRQSAQHPRPDIGVLPVPHGCPRAVIEWLESRGRQLCARFWSKTGTSRPPISRRAGSTIRPFYIAQPAAAADCEVLSTGETTQRVAKRFRVSPARISQLRQFFKSAWDRFHMTPREEALAAA